MIIVDILVITVISLVLLAFDDE